MRHYYLEKQCYFFMNIAFSLPLTRIIIEIRSNIVNAFKYPA
jgi:hypothetical protein